MTAETLAAPRSSSPRRNRGVNLEKWGWLYMRISGVLLVVLIFGHLFMNLMVTGISGLDFGFVMGKLTTPLWQWWDVAMLWLGLIHGANGMRTITNDYVINQTARRVLVTAIWVAAGLLILLGTLVVFTFDPCNGVFQDGSMWSACQEYLARTGS